MQFGWRNEKHTTYKWEKKTKKETEIEIFFLNAKQHGSKLALYIDPEALASTALL